jgi:LysM repeat protein
MMIKNKQLVLWFSLFCAGLLVASVSFAEPLFRREKVVVVQPNETLSDIVRRERGSSDDWRGVARHNGITNPRALRPGQKIRIPFAYTRSAEYAVVLFVKGKTQLQLAGKSKKNKLKRGEKIKVGDEIYTGTDGFASVAFSSGSVVSVQPNSHILIVDIACENANKKCIIELHAEKGGVQSRVKSTSTQAVEFQINTPIGSAAVRGTVFDVNTSSTQLVSGVTQGRVDIKSAGKLVPLDQGFGLVAKAGQAPNSPVPLLGRPVLKEPAPRLATNDRVQWFEDSDAVSYQVQIAGDELFKTVRLTHIVDDAFFKNPLSESGLHYIEVRAIDRLGLKGLPAVMPIKLVAIDTSVAAPGLLSLLEVNQAVFSLKESVLNSRGVYELQVSSERDFLHFSSSDIALHQGVQMTIEPGETLWARAREVLSGNQVSRYSPLVAVSRP